MMRRWLAAVDARRSSAWPTTSTAVKKPTANSVPQPATGDKVPVRREVDHAVLSERCIPEEAGARFFAQAYVNRNDAGGWQPSTLQVDRILGSWIRGNVYTRKDGANVYGFIYDAGSDGGAGMNRFGELVLSGH